MSAVNKCRIKNTHRRIDDDDEKKIWVGVGGRMGKRRFMEVGWARDDVLWKSDGQETMPYRSFKI